MHTPRYRLEVTDVEGKGPEVPIPSDHVKRVMAIVIAGDPVPCLDSDLVFPFLIVGYKLVRRTDVALRIGRMFNELAVLV